MLRGMCACGILLQPEALCQVKQHVQGQGARDVRLTCRGFVQLVFYVLSGDDGKRDSLLFPAHRMTHVSKIFEVLGFDLCH